MADLSQLATLALVGGRGFGNLSVGAANRHLTDSRKDGKEYDQLQKDTDMLNALEACGVDNWEGYSKAHKYLREQEEEQK